MNLAQKNLDKFGTGAINIDDIAIARHENKEEGRVYWVMKDGSAIYMTTHKEIGAVDKY